MILSDIETAVRQDLFDPLGNPNQRWATSDLDRAIDKAVDRYSQYYPNIVYTDMNTQPYQRTYPYPVSWNASYPVWWLERVIYPLQAYGSAFAPPTSAASATPASGTTLGVGVYQYVVTLLTQGGETTPSLVTSVTTTTNNQKVTLSSIPLGSTVTTVPGTATNTVIGRNLYRTQVGGTTFFLLATLQDNTTTTYSDSTPDTALANKPQPPTVNTSGVMLWPPFERDFAEYSNLFDSTVALATGGNLGLQGTIGIGQGPTGTTAPTFTLKLSSAELPQDSSLVIRVFYATKHQLDANGSTIPEVHRDIIVLGACTYAMEAYQIPTNDNFDFQDGSIHDRVDDTKIPHAWLLASQAKLQQFEARLQEIKQQRDFAYGTRAHWGDVPLRWERL
ncbi:MAG TPA: hypothetical protein VFB12_14750 [Ktedonobacteraceae bacterium]|nr:hypothetical protein [Ktedonobacteraceae bacterium]